MTDEDSALKSSVSDKSAPNVQGGDGVGHGGGLGDGLEAGLDVRDSSPKRTRKPSPKQVAQAVSSVR